MRILILLACMAACDREAVREPVHPDIAVVVHSMAPTPRPELPSVEDEPIDRGDIIVVVSDGDRDSDGVPDVVDKCPDEPEDINGYQDNDGCPDPDPGDGPVEVVE